MIPLYVFFTSTDGATAWVTLSELIVGTIAGAVIVVVKP